jgi:hypothetical protein
MTVHFLVDNIKFPPIPNHEIGKYTGYTSIHANKCIVYLFSKFVIRLSTFFSLHYFVGGSTSCSGNRGRRCRDQRHFQQYLVTISFIAEGNRSARKKPPICRKLMTNFIT